MRLQSHAQRSTVEHGAKIFANLVRVDIDGADNLHVATRGHQPRHTNADGTQTEMYYPRFRQCACLDLC